MDVIGYFIYCFFWLAFLKYYRCKCGLDKNTLKPVSQPVELSDGLYHVTGKNSPGVKGTARKPILAEVLAKRISLIL